MKTEKKTPRYANATLEEIDLETVKPEDFEIIPNEWFMKEYGIEIDKKYTIYDLRLTFQNLIIQNLNTWHQLVNKLNEHLGENYFYIERVLFDFIEINEDLNFNNCIIELSSLMSTTLNGKLNCKNTIFLNTFATINTTFNNITNFENAIFYRTANFESSKFKTLCYFTDSKFIEKVSFKKCEFHHEAYFQSVIFGNSANFVEAIFLNKSTFNNTIFKGISSFINAIFNDIVNFNNSQFKDDSSFDEAEFRGYCLLNITKFYERVYFTNTEFKKQAHFKYIYNSGEIIFDNIKMENLIFDKVNLSKNFTFSNVIWKELNSQIVLLSFDKDAKKHFHELVNYYDSTREFDMAEKMFISEMELRREIALDEKQFLTAFGFWIYNMFSKYGTSWTRALITLCIMLITIPLIMQLNTFEIKETIDNYYVNTHMSLSSYFEHFKEPFRMLLLHKDIYNAPNNTGWNFGIRIFSQLILLGQAALMFLAIRRSFRRSPNASQ